MNVYAAIILCFIPFITVFLLLKIFIDEISITKELIACALGLLALIPITVLQYSFGDFFQIKGRMFFALLFRAILLYGLIEEGFKCAALFLLPVKKCNLKEIFFYGLLAGLFLGCFESVIYILSSIQKASAHSGTVLLYLIYIRSFTSILIHAFAAGLLAMFVYSVKNKCIRVSALVYPVLLHGLYDFFVIMPKPMNIFSYVIILLLLLECRISYVRIKERLS
ncbi:MAG: PrsW family intramembrane metalloprotease [Treponema sp.]|nr:PrsW family intramembrane metalloprotease [Candidatus Treponema merdequi]